MAYTNRPNVVETTTVQPAVDYHDRVRWGPIIAGLFTALATQLVLSGIGAAIGFTSIAGSGAPRSNADDAANAVGIWTIISLFISLFLGSWIMARCCGPMNRSTALLNGAVLWATTLALSAWLLANGVSGAFGILASNAGEIAGQAQQQIQSGNVDVPNQAPNVTAQQTRDIAGNAAKVGWSFAFGSLLGLISSLIGAVVGARSYRNVQRDTTVYRES
ncbi:hypothetical protein H6F43_13805 [Leptolyngbya sp. FACHB-36]|uniref:hypothetical protein n=1 Tax=Leptolyngbya sp. FACHB-36 TaxID=2692808 RepID=UPI001681625F|nr:hypothetical protein [Leptolyngbya sp. FACHB-36]MBD2021252.1 hypothetical protein [Leptolyngbya sp. FACHB-36]